MSKTEVKSIPAFSLKLLGDKKPGVTLPIKLQQAEGQSIDINLMVNAMRKSAWIAMRDANIAERETAASEGEGFFARLVGGGDKKSAQIITQVVTGWDLEEKMSAENLLKLEDFVPGALGSILSALDGLMLQGKLGN